MNVVLNGPNIPVSVTGLDNFYLNYNNAVPFVSGLDFKMVLQTDPAGTFNATTGDGTVNFNNQGPAGTTLDILLDPSGPASFTFSGSLVLRSNSVGHLESNLDASMFDLKDANNLLYSAFDTKPANQAFKYGATSDGLVISAVPEPSSILLFATALFGLALRRRPQS